MDHQPRVEHHGALDPVGEARAEHARRAAEGQQAEVTGGAADRRGDGEGYDGDGLEDDRIGASLYPYLDDDGSWAPYYGDSWHGGGFNATERLLEIFPSADANDDGHLTREELVVWTHAQHLNTSARRRQRDLEWQDSDGDGLVSFREYLMHMLWGVQADAIPERPEQYEPRALRVALGEAAEAYHWIESMQRRFKVADSDGDGQLDFAQFQDFHHPADSDRPEVLAELRREEVERFDTDGDNRIDLDELRAAYEHDIKWHRLSWDVPQDVVDKDVQLLLEETDVDGDHAIDASEIGPLLKYLEPSDLDLAEETVDDIVDKADADGDGVLSLQEMLNSEGAIYTFTHKTSEEFYYSSYFSHDEF